MILALALVAVLAGEETAVRAAREEFNAAITRRDADAIARLLAPGYHIAARPAVGGPGLGPGLRRD